MQITSQQDKIQLVEKLLKDGHIDFQQAIKLLETEKEYIYYPNTWQFPVHPFTNPEVTYTTNSQ